MGAQGTVELDFGAFPGKSDASIAVTGQASIVAGSLVEAWLRPVANSDRSADEHMLETVKVFAHSIVAGDGFTISGFNTSELNEPLAPFKGVTGTIAGGLGSPPRDQLPTQGGQGTRLYGKFTVAWVWN